MLSVTIDVAIVVQDYLIEMQAITGSLTVLRGLQNHDAALTGSYSALVFSVCQNISQK